MDEQSSPGEQAPDPPAEVNEGETPPLPAEVEDRSEGTAPRGDRTLKIVASVVAALTFIASGASATAAWFSWRTAMASEQLSRESQQLARATAERQGVLLVADQYIGLGGHCGTDSSLVAYVMVLNLGLVAGRVEGMVLAIDAEQNLQQKIRYPNGKSGAGVAFDTTKIVVKPQDSALVTLRFSCPALAAQGFNLDHAKEEITASIEKKVLKWRIVPFWGYNSAAAQAKPRPGPGDTTRTVGP